jgi:hypothetical protein
MQHWMGTKRGSVLRLRETAFRPPSGLREVVLRLPPGSCEVALRSPPGPGRHGRGRPPPGPSRRGPPMLGSLARCAAIARGAAHARSSHAGKPAVRGCYAGSSLVAAWRRGGSMENRRRKKRRRGCGVRREAADDAGEKAHEQSRQLAFSTTRGAHTSYPGHTGASRLV